MAAIAKYSTARVALRHYDSPAVLLGVFQRFTNVLVRMHEINVKQLTSVYETVYAKGATKGRDSVDARLPVD